MSLGVPARTRTVGVDEHAGGVTEVRSDRHDRGRRVAVVTCVSDTMGASYSRTVHDGCAMSETYASGG